MITAIAQYDPFLCIQHLTRASMRCFALYPNGYMYEQDVSVGCQKKCFRTMTEALLIYAFIHNILSEIIIERQNKAAQNINTNDTVIQSNDEADQLKKYKDLLDQGVITQEEFDAKKKQLLGL